MTTFHGVVQRISGTGSSANGGGVQVFGTYKNGLYYLAYPPSVSPTNGTGVVVSDTLYATPLVINAPVTIDRLGVRTASTSTGNGSVVKGAVYANNPATGLPGARLALATNAGAGFSSAGASTNVLMSFDAGNLTLQPGVYWAATLHSFVTTAAIFRSQNSVNSGAFIGYESADNVNSSTPIIAYTRGSVAFAGGPPDPFGAGTVFSMNGASVVPFSFFRVA